MIASMQFENLDDEQYERLKTAFPDINLDWDGCNDKIATIYNVTEQDLAKLYLELNLLFPKN